MVEECEAGYLCLLGLRPPSLTLPHAARGEGTKCAVTLLPHPAAPSHWLLGRFRSPAVSSAVPCRFVRSGVLKSLTCAFNNSSVQTFRNYATCQRDRPALLASLLETTQARRNYSGTRGMVISASWNESTRALLRERRDWRAVS